MRGGARVEDRLLADESGDGVGVEVARARLLHDGLPVRERVEDVPLGGRQLLGLHLRVVGEAAAEHVERLHVVVARAVDAAPSPDSDAGSCGAASSALSSSACAVLVEADGVELVGLRCARVLGGAGVLFGDARRALGCRRRARRASRARSLSAGSSLPLRSSKRSRRCAREVAVPVGRRSGRASLRRARALRRGGPARSESRAAQ